MMNLRGGARMQYLLFHLEKQSYAIEIQSIERVIWAIAIRKIPNSNEYIQGCIVIHDETIPVINLRKQLSYPLKDLDINDQFIICKMGEERAAFWVDHVDKIIDIETAESLSYKHTSSPYLPKFFLHNKGEVVFIYDPSKFLCKQGSKVGDIE